MGTLARVLASQRLSGGSGGSHRFPPSSSLPWEVTPLYTGGVVDCDIHHDWPSPAALYPYLSTGWREYVLAPTRVGLPAIPLAPIQMCPNPGGSTCRPDAFPG